VWSDIGWLLLAEAGITRAHVRLPAAAHAFELHHVDALARRCHDLLARPTEHPLTKLGVTPRELEILALVAQGLTNRDIATRLTLSPRTVEKHVESLLRKTSSTSRTQLVAVSQGRARIRMPAT
jgi:DNA-binding NarL/FixJ family response regulator